MAHRRSIAKPNILPSSMSTSILTTSKNNSSSNSTNSANNEIAACCVEDSLFRLHMPLAYGLTISDEVGLAPIDSSSSTESVEQSPSLTPDTVPIFHPNEVLLQRFPHKVSMKRVSEIRLAARSQVSGSLSLSNASGSLSPTRKSRSSSIIETLSRMSSRNNEPANPTTTTTMPNESNDHINATNTSTTNSTTCTGAFPCKPCKITTTPTSESSHDYLTRLGTKGTLYVTSERLLFLSDDQSSQSSSGDVPASGPAQGTEFDISIAAIDTMKVVESDKGMWFFVCYDGLYLSTIPFKTSSRARSFLKLISNIRFEQMVRHSLPPKYSSITKPCCSSGHHPMCEACASLDHSDWEAEDNKLPTYLESEEAVRQYLINLKLIPSDSPFDRQNSTFDVMSMLAQACSPPSLDGPTTATVQQPPQPPQRRRQSTPNTPGRSRIVGRVIHSNPDDRLYGVPLVWI